MTDNPDGVRGAIALARHLLELARVRHGEKVKES